MGDYDTGYIDGLSDAMRRRPEDAPAGADHPEATPIRI